VRKEEKLGEGARTQKQGSYAKELHLSGFMENVGGQSEKLKGWRERSRHKLAMGKKKRRN